MLTAAVAAIAMLGMLGLAVDGGRLYITKNEAQVYADSSALDAALELDGTQAGLTRARNAVASGRNQWNMATRTFNNTVTEFALSQDGPWESNPLTAFNYRFVRVNASAAVSITFVRILGAGGTSVVSAAAVAGQVPRTTFREGLFPFSPLAHSEVGPDFGLIRGEIYTLRWAANPRLNQNTCAGDNAPPWINQAERGGGSERGYIEETSSERIRESIQGDYQTRPITVGESVNMTGGAKQTIRSSIQDRVSQDSDPTSSTYAQYLANGNGNGRRMVVVALNTWHPDYRVVGFGAFFLLPPNQYTAGGNQPFCAEYVGPWVQGSRQGGAGTGGAYVVRLVQ